MSTHKATFLRTSNGFKAYTIDNGGILFLPETSPQNAGETSLIKELHLDIKTPSESRASDLEIKKALLSELIR